MQQDSEKIFDAALKLSEDERLALVSRLMATMPAENLTIALDDPDLANELERRFADSGGAIAWSNLRAES
jgi:putative addiction module component (TIGR02574 family)